MQDKSIKTAVLVASLTVAAFVLADAIDTRIGKNLESALKRPTAPESGSPGMDPLRGPGEQSFIKKPVRANSGVEMARRNSIGKPQNVETGFEAGIKKVSDSTWFVDKKRCLRTQKA